MARARVDIRNVSFGFSRSASCIFRGLSLTVESGELVWLAGPNGVGKSTLLRLIAGVLRPTVGEIHINGSLAADARVGFVFQDPSASMLPWYSARKNIETPLRWAGVSEGEISRRVDEAVALLSIRFDLSRYAYELSGGEQQLVSIARGMALRPDVLLLDEPFSQLDLRHHMSVESFLMRLRDDHGPPIILVAHEMETALVVATRCVLLDGKPAGIVLDEATGGTSRTGTEGEGVPELLEQRIRGLYAS